ncbi:MAG: type II toxin-antitoxin system death-on-curing family toxin [Opitutales bacterium]|nr:type II toxin-antitoxin system death-on-curing family toxin [Opitutales bacterium]NRA25709.1 type II toxin-antitoxin system death-on-curing family toxin [Opitutales bacterium]
MASEPNWLELADVVSTHHALIYRFGGSDGIRDENALEAALGRPINRFYYEDPTVYELAASYAFGLVVNHPFIDGNKRIGFMAAYTFLGINGYRLTAPEEEAVLNTLALAARQMEEAEYATWLENGCELR